MFKIFTIKIQAEAYHVFGQGIPLHPWAKLATDLFHFEGASYLLIVDYTGRFLVVCKLSSMTGQHVANHCKQVFSEYCYVWQC